MGTNKQIFNEIYDPEFLWEIIQDMVYEAISNNDFENLITRLLTMVSHKSYKDMVDKFMNSEAYEQYKEVIKGELNG